MPSSPDDPLQSPAIGENETNPNITKEREKGSPFPSTTRLPYRRSNASLQSLFASTTALPSGRPVRSSSGSGTVTPTASSSALTSNGNLLVPDGSTTSNRSTSPALTVKGYESADGLKELTLRAFAPHVSILASQDTEELVRHKGVHGGLLELLRPFGERVQGKVTIRDSAGVSRSWEDFSIKFVGVKDGLEIPRPPSAPRRSSLDSSVSNSEANDRRRGSLLEYKPARLRTGGDVSQIEDLVERHLTFAEEHSGPSGTEYITPGAPVEPGLHSVSPFYRLFFTRLLSGLPVTASETFAHPVASVIAISSRNPAPIEELRSLYTSSNTGELRLPQWVHNEFLRYYVLVHDEDYDDIAKSMTLYEQMKRHFGLHCHLLRLRSKQCDPDDSNGVCLPSCAWTSAAEDLAEIVRRENSEEDQEIDPTPTIFDSDLQAINSFVRELVTQSVVPNMERASANWNDQVASRRRGISGRFMSLSKRFTFGAAGGNRGSSGLGAGGGSNYDSLQGFYHPDTPEAIMRKLADYAMMLRDWKLAYSTFEVLCADFKSDKAWRYYAAASEMAVVSSLLAASMSTSPSAKVRIDVLDNYLDAAYYSYITRCSAPYNALRTVLLGTELLKVRGGPAAIDVAAKWCTRILEDRVVGPVGHALIMERIANSFAQHRRFDQKEDRGRKAAFWHTLASEAWLRMDKLSQAEECLEHAFALHSPQGSRVEFQGVVAFLHHLEQSIKNGRLGPQQLLNAQIVDQGEEVETLQEVKDQVPTLRSPPVAHRQSLSLAGMGLSSTIGTGHSRPSSFHSQLSNVSSLPTQDAIIDPLGAVKGAYEDAMPTEPPNVQPALTGLSSTTQILETSSQAGPASPRFERGNDGFE